MSALIDLKLYDTFVASRLRNLAQQQQQMEQERYPYLGNKGNSYDNTDDDDDASVIKFDKNTNKNKIQTTITL
eukprot:UN08405